jgi:FkbM family methyltransferase
MSTSAEQKAIGDILRSCNQRPIFFELGAYGGEDSEMMRAACKDSHHLNVIVEPDHRNMEIIRKYRRGTRTLLVEAAIADYTGQIPFYGSVDERCEGGRSGSGSIRHPDPHQRIFPEIRFPLDKANLLPCMSLDHLFLSVGVPYIDLLWVDIQGAERDMIAGGGLALSKTRYLFIEAEQTELYEGQALREELLSLLPGFKVIQELDYNLLLEAK